MCVCTEPIEGENTAGFGAFRPARSSGMALAGRSQSGFKPSEQPDLSFMTGGLEDSGASRNGDSYEEVS